jgi:transposase-like protein
MGTKDKERRVYPKEFKAEVTPVEKHDKPVRQTAADLGINENMLHRWGCSSPGKQGAQARRPSPDTDGCGTSRTLVRARPPGERNQSVAGGGVKPRFTRNPKKSI